MSDKFWMWLAWRLPRRLAMWATVRVGAHATSGPWSSEQTPSLLMVDALARWSPSPEEPQ